MIIEVVIFILLMLCAFSAGWICHRGFVMNKLNDIIDRRKQLVHRRAAMGDKCIFIQELGYGKAIADVGVALKTIKREDVPALFNDYEEVSNNEA